MPRTTAPSTNPRILSGYAPYAKSLNEFSSASKSKGLISTTEGRRQLLLDDPHAQDVQPEQVTCTRCAKTVRLQKGKKYHLAHWLDHRWRCDRAAVDPQPRAKCRTLLERKAVLEADRDAKLVEPDRVVCGRCEKEVKLRKGRAYGLSCWTQHKMTCQPSSQSPVPSGSASTSPSPPPSETHIALTSDPLVAALDSQRAKCALCLSWINIGLQKDLDVHAWRRHRTSCVADNFADDKAGWTRPRFFRPRHRLTSATDMSNTNVCDSPEAEEPPLSAQLSSDSTSESRPSKVPKALPAIRVDSAPSPSRSVSPPPLSFSTATSAATSVASTPMPSPRRGTSLFSNSRHLPFPEYTPGLSRLGLDRQERDEHKTGPGALGLHISPRSPSPSSDSSSSPPPYLERTPISLPIPERYWRFESVE